MTYLYFLLRVLIFGNKYGFMCLILENMDLSSRAFHAYNMNYKEDIETRFFCI